MKLFFTAPGSSMHQFVNWLAAHGFVCVREYVSHGALMDFRRGEDGAQLVRDHGFRSLGFFGPNEGALADEACGHFPLVRCDSVAASSWPSNLTEQLQLLWKCSYTAQNATVVPTIRAALFSDSPWVRAAALGCVGVNAETQALLAEAAEIFPDLRAASARYEQLAQAAAAGTVNDEPTDDAYVLRGRARQSAIAGVQWQRVFDSAFAVVHKDTWDQEMCWLAGRALVELDQPWRAMLFVGLALEEDEQQRAKWPLGNELTETFVSTARVKAVASLAAHPENAALLIDEAEQIFNRCILARKHKAVASAASALHGLLPSIDSALAWLRDFDDPIAATHLPQSRVVRFYAARRSLRDDAPSGEAALRTLLNELRENVPAPASAAETFLAAVTAGNQWEPTLPRLYHALASFFYEQHRYAEALPVAKAWRDACPDEITAWEIVANSLIFDHRDQEALVACREAAITAERVWRSNGNKNIFDSRPAVYFNYACIAARLDQTDEALTALGKCLALDPDRAEEAQTDEYLQSLWKLPRFKAIIVGLTDAPVRAESSVAETDAHEVAETDAHDTHGGDGGDAQGASAFQSDASNVLRQMITRALELGMKGQIDAALELAEPAAEEASMMDLEFAAEGEAVVARLLLMSGSLAEAREHIQHAEETARTLRAPSAEEGVFAQLGVCYQLLGQLADAEAACSRAFAARRRRCGPQHPVLLKSLNALVGLAFEMGAIERVEQYLREARGIADVFFASSPTLDHVWLDALDASIALAAWRLRLAVREQHPAAAADALTEAVTHLELEQRAGVDLPDLSALYLFAEAALAQKGEPAAGARLQAAGDRLATILFGPAGATREIRRVFFGLRRDTQRLHQAGVDPGHITENIINAVRGQPIADDLSQVPDLQELRTITVKLLASQPSDTGLVTLAMATEVAIASESCEVLLQKLESHYLSFAR